MTHDSEHDAEAAKPTVRTQAKRQVKGQTQAALIPTDLAKQFAWFGVRLVVSYSVVAVVVDGLSPLLEVLIARGARNLLASVSSPYYLKTIEWVQEGFAVSTWIGPLRDGFKLPSLSFIFSFAIGYVLALPGFLGAAYWLRALAVVLTSFFVCSLAVAIVSDARLTAALGQLEIAMQPAWRASASNFVQFYLWMLTVRLYPMLMVVLLTWESGAFRKVPRASTAVRRFRTVAVASLALLLVIAMSFDPFAERRIERVEAESMTERIEAIALTTPDLGRGLVKLAEHMHRQRDTRGALQIYRRALDQLEGAERREVLETYNRIHESFKEQLLEDSKARRSQRARPRR